MSVDLKRYIREVPDFPTPGISFKDIAPLLGDPQALRAAVDQLAEVCTDESLRPDIIAGPEARGFIFGTALAYHLGVGFVPIRKPGKLPYETRSIEYDLEYGTDTIEMHVDAVEKGQRVAIVDDLLATGGTVAASANLIAAAGAQVVGCLFVVELAFLNGRDKLGDHPVHSLVTY